MKYYFTFHTLILFFASLVLFSCKQDYARDIRLENEIIESFIWEYFTQYNDTVYDENGNIYIAIADVSVGTPLSD